MSDVINQSETLYNLPPLTKGLGGSNMPKYSVIDSKLYETHLTELKNGLKVASEKLYGDFCTVGGR
jgi:hypothetical protein